MRQVWIPKHGLPEVLQVRDAPDPEPGKGEVRIDVHFSGINFADILARMGLYPDSPKVPCVIGYEVSGLVDKAGEGIDSSWIGKRVVSFTRFGGYSNKVIVTTGQLAEVSQDVSLESAAALPVNYVTAYIMMMEQARLSAGETVLIHGIGGGVGIAVLQLAAILKADVIGTASSGKHERLRKMGAEKLIDYHDEDFVKRTMQLTDGCGVDLVLDPIGGKNFWRSYQCLRPLGNVIFFGFSSSAPGKRRSLVSGLKALLSTKRYHPVRLMNANKGVMGCNLGHLWRERERLKRGMNQLMEWLAEGKIAPVVDEIFPFDKAADAHRYIQDRKNFGKVLLTPHER
ncbi:MAG: zinc-binding dehydrogenase [Candidatus Marinimicrobia bacterium]|jgi:NADPH:quinone reductase-like Zn-dependent oxidoreductase|nr:alcohol dehydrogenase [Candidatus Neomarinimicrobiota bacterium]MDP6455958.1 zinc-binding dehydrogenase [Candidatus Neomarinimicrobiota bacterium]MDP6593960.1 zinc-binding dehydrogenase [Candidatus Neomarinimicrobiota bacterium]MDP6835676.1 zinc-binding dehydrogenase [Candidatus Neomarinimicrobiota bacterium]|tara:strand:- start:4858 stop:5883 length:1026 start_codon:yes stop_codon:yes gene_type:complete